MQGGSVERMSYEVPDLARDKKEKFLNVYLPKDYDEGDVEKRYNVLYLMHGGGEDENLLLGGPGQSLELKNIFDHMIANGEIEPLIVVTPTFNGEKKWEQGKPDLILEAEKFYEELVRDVIVKVETKYNTYTRSDSEDGLKAARKHRAFGGFSLGSMATWQVFVHCLDYFKYFLPLSGECWEYGRHSEGKYAKKTVDFLVEKVKISGYKPSDFYLFCATGEKDIAYPHMKPMMEEMKKRSNIFMESTDLQEGNFYFMECKDGDHRWYWINQYIYDILPDVFKH